ncbi:hypothetical protein MRX96_057048 [Rhipicephalus microplus]|uniref:Putative trypsin inhibitor like cysteine rich domain protein n=1 Tax=Rhipicephalus microplus TaxID=6941 RepID=A0A6G5A5G9_RHIMP
MCNTAYAVVLMFFSVCALQLYVEGYENLRETTASRGGSQNFSACKKHEEYKECVSGSCSEWKCRYLWKGWPTRCTRDCREGCFCKHGYFRTRKNRCELGYHCFYEYKASSNNRPE